MQVPWKMKEHYCAKRYLPYLCSIVVKSIAKGSVCSPTASLSSAFKFKVDLTHGDVLFSIPIFKGNSNRTNPDPNDAWRCFPFHRSGRSCNNFDEYAIRPAFAGQ
jgi:hypothetical protein